MIVMENSENFPTIKKGAGEENEEQEMYPIACYCTLESF